MDKLQIVTELIKNSTSVYVKSFLSAYIADMELYAGEPDFNIHDDLQSFDRCISYLQSVQFGLNNGELNESDWVPFKDVYRFFNANNNQTFDLVVRINGDVIPYYISDKSNRHMATSIQEAIKKHTISA